MVADAEPIVEGLEREVDVFSGFKLENIEAIVAVYGKDVEGRTLAVEAAQSLAINTRRVNCGLDLLDAVAHLRFKPALGLGQVVGIDAVWGIALSKRENFLDEFFDGRDVGWGGCALAAEAELESGFVVAGGGAKPGHLKAVYAVAEAAIGLFDPVNGLMLCQKVDPPGGTSEAGVARGESRIKIAAIGRVEEVFSAVLRVEPDIDVELFGMEMSGEKNDRAGVAFWQVEKEVIFLNVIEPDQGEGKGVEAGVAIRGGQGGHGLLTLREESGGKDRGERVFELGFATEGIPAPVAIVAV